MLQHSSIFLQEFLESSASSNGNNGYPNDDYGHLTTSSFNLLNNQTFYLNGLKLILSNQSILSQFLSSTTLSHANTSSNMTSSSSTTSSSTPILMNNSLSAHFTFATRNLIKSNHSNISLSRVLQSFNVDHSFHKPSLREAKSAENGVKKGSHNFSFSLTHTRTNNEYISHTDYFLYGRLYLPSRRLDGLYIHRLTPTLQSIISLVCVPSPVAPAPLVWAPTTSATIEDTTHRSSTTTSSSATTTSTSTGGSATAMRESEMEFKLQHDTGRWNSEYSYAIGDAMWGMKGLYHFGKNANASAGVPTSSSPPLGSTFGINTSNTRNTTTTTTTTMTPESTRVTITPVTSTTTTPNSIPSTTTFDATSDATESAEESSGLKGRWSAGGEVYFSAQERSAGVSTGVRFSTLPEPPLSSPSASPSQPPTVITATINPIMGHLSTAYAVGITRNSSWCSRFDFNMFSYDADLTIGGAWLQRRRPVVPLDIVEGAEVESETIKQKAFDPFHRNGVEEGENTSRTNGHDDTTVMIRGENEVDDDVIGVVKFRASTNTVRCLFSYNYTFSCSSHSFARNSSTHILPPHHDQDLAIAWEGKLGSFLVSIGLVADLRSPSSSSSSSSTASSSSQRSRGSQPPHFIKSFGIGVQYWG